MRELPPLINVLPFINRASEMRFLCSWIAEQPKNILFVYGPKSSGKTTLLSRFLDENLSAENYDLKHFNLRELFLINYESFLHAFFELQSSEQVKETRQYDLKVFKLSVETLKGLEAKSLDPFVVMKREMEKMVRQGRRPVIVIDELQALDEIYFNGGRELLKEMFNFFVAMTKESHLCHVVVASSDGFFLERIYKDSRLKKTSEFMEVDYLGRQDVLDWLAHLERYSRIEQFILTMKQRGAIWDFFGGSCWEISNFLGHLLLVAADGGIDGRNFQALMEKRRIAMRSMFAEYATIIPRKRALLSELARVVAVQRAFAVNDLAALVERGFWSAEDLVNELNVLVRQNFLSYAPPRAEYALQGRSMEHGLLAYAEMIGG